MIDKHMDIKAHHDSSSSFELRPFSGLISPSPESPLTLGYKFDKSFSLFSVMILKVLKDTLNSLSSIVVICGDCGFLIILKLVKFPMENLRVLMMANM